MSLRLNMAKNLQLLCAQKGSANLVARETGINRQQLEKYLKGRSLPSRSTLKKLCDYFSMTEEELFSPVLDAGARHARNQPISTRSCDAAIQPLLSEPTASIKPGIYLLWMSVPTEPDGIVCAPIVIERHDDALTFRRITGSAEASHRLWWHRVGDHKGIVVERLNWFLFVAVNQRGNLEPSLVRLKWVPLSVAVLGGHATILTPTGISFAVACMRPAPSGMTFRQALRHSRKYHKDDPSIDSITKMVLDQQRQDLLQLIVRDVSPS
jgi:transcriptional regulator with XRE-family HTH domain